MQREQQQQQAEKDKQKGDSDPENGERRDEPTDRSKGNPDKKDDKTGASSETKAPGWFVTLPKQVRDYFSGGHFEKIPSRYRFLINKYNRWLNKKRATGGR